MRKQFAPASPHGLAVAVAFSLAGQTVAMEPPAVSPNVSTPGSVSQAVSPQSQKIFVKFREAPGPVGPRSSSEVARTYSNRLGISLRAEAAPSGENAQILILDTPQNLDAVEDIAQRIERDPDVEYAVAERLLQIQQVPDPLFIDQWHYYEAGVGVNLVPAWQIATGDGVVIAVIDTGVLPHQDLAGHILPGHDFITEVWRANDGDDRDADATDPGDWVNAGACVAVPPSPPSPSSWHGTHVAGTVAAITDNGLGVAGVARDARILPVRVLGRCGGSNLDIADGMLWAAGITIGGVGNPNPLKF